MHEQGEKHLSTLTCKLRPPGRWAGWTLPPRLVEQVCNLFHAQLEKLCHLAGRGSGVGAAKTTAKVVA
jgi:hypothetical protein